MVGMVAGLCCVFGCVLVAVLVFLVIGLRLVFDMLIVLYVFVVV